MKADCPGCGRANESTTDIWWCPICQAQYDDDPDEGGKFSGNNPLKNLINKEGFEERQKKRKREHQFKPRHGQSGRQYRR